MRYYGVKENWNNGKYFECLDKKSKYEEVMVFGYTNGKWFFDCRDILTGAWNGNRMNYTPKEVYYIKNILWERLAK